VYFGGKAEASAPVVVVIRFFDIRARGLKPQFQLIFGLVIVGKSYIL
jgi:hypothetical protein